VSSLIEYLYAGLLSVIPLSAYFEVSFTALHSCVFNNAHNGLFVQNFDVSKSFFHRLIPIRSFVVVVDRRKLVVIDTVEVFPRDETEVRSILNCMWGAERPQYVRGGSSRCISPGESSTTLGTSVQLSLCNRASGSKAILATVPSAAKISSIN